MTYSGFDISVEWVELRHIAEGRLCREYQGPAIDLLGCRRDYLGELPSCDVTAWAKGVVAIPGR